MKHIFPYVLTALDLCAAIFYLINKDYWRDGYWIAAGFLTFSTTKI